MWVIVTDIALHLAVEVLKRIFPNSYLPWYGYLTAMFDYKWLRLTWKLCYNCTTHPHWDKAKIGVFWESQKGRYSDKGGCCWRPELLGSVLKSIRMVWVSRKCRLETISDQPGPFFVNILHFSHLLWLFVSVEDFYAVVICALPFESGIIGT